MFRVMQGGRQSRLFSRTYLHFFALTLWDYLKQGGSHTIRFTLILGICDAFQLYKQRLCRFKRSLSPFNLPFLKELVFVSEVFLLALLSHENLHSLPEVVSRVFSPESTPLVIQQFPLLS